MFHFINMFKVKFIDYGNDEIVVVGNMLEIDRVLQSYAPQATLCYVYGIQATNGVWSQDIIRQLNERICYEEYLLDVLGNVVNIIKVQHGYVCIAFQEHSTIVQSSKYI